MTHGIHSILNDGGKSVKHIGTLRLQNRPFEINNREKATFAIHKSALSLSILVSQNNNKTQTCKDSHISNTH